MLQPLEGAELAADAGFPVYTIALGTPEGVIDRGQFGGFGFAATRAASSSIPVPPDPETLREIAEMTGGEFSEARTATRSNPPTSSSARPRPQARARSRSPSCSSRRAPASCSRRRSSRRVCLAAASRRRLTRPTIVKARRPCRRARRDAS